MGEGSPRRWELDREALDGLLRALGPDREAASVRYEALRRRLIDLFAWERADVPEELADETLNRLARRLAGGLALEPGAIDRYAFGIARLLLHEDARARRRRDAALVDLPLHLSRDEESDTLRALLSCLDALPADSRRLIERYYSEDRSTLASALGISVNALRNRALRVRDQLHDCVTRTRDK